MRESEHDLKEAVCPNCQRDMRVEILLEHATSWMDDEYQIDGSDRYWVLECKGCGKIFFGHGSTFSEEVDHRFNHGTQQWEMYRPENRTFYPRTRKRQKPAWFDLKVSLEMGEVYYVLQEVYSALDNDLPILSAIGMRTTLDALAIHLGANESDSFKDKIETLRSKNHITGRERDFLEVLAEAGGSAAHRSWKPKDDELATMMEIIEGTIHRALILPKRVEKLKMNVPLKKK